MKKKIIYTTTVLFFGITQCFSVQNVIEDSGLSSVGIIEELNQDLVDVPGISEANSPIKKKSFRKPKLELKKAHGLYEDLRFCSMGGTQALTLKEQSRTFPVLLILWGSSCAPCLREFPSLERLAGVMPTLKIICVAIDGPNEFTSTLPLFYIHGQNTQNFLEKHAIQSIPSFFLFDTLGKLLWNGVGAKEWDSPPVLEKIKSLIHPSKKNKNPKKIKQKRIKKNLHYTKNRFR